MHTVMEPPKDEHRDQFIPMRKADLISTLLERGELAEPEKFRQLCRLLASIFHYEYFEQLERLRDDYFYFNPQIDTQKRFEAMTIDAAYTDLTDALAKVLKGANFVEMSHDDVQKEHRESALVRVTLRAPIEQFREVRFFRRGRHTETFEIPRWFGLRRKVEAMVHDDVVLMVAMKSASDLGGRASRKLRAHRKCRPGAVLIKYFRNIASADLNALFPNVEVVMSRFDKIFLGVPALAGGVPILLNLWSTVTVMGLVIGAYLGISGAVEESQLKTALAGVSGLVALGGFIMRQWTKYQRQSLKYQKEVTDNVYYRNINNNAGIFDYIIGAAEEQECKEAFLAYYFLSTAASPPTEKELDLRIEQWLKDTFSVDIDFEVDDALAKLERLGLLKHDGDRLTVRPPQEALERLDYKWDNYFQYNNVDPAAGSGQRVR